MNVEFSRRFQKDFNRLSKNNNLANLYRYGICNSPINCTITATLSALYQIDFGLKYSM